MNTELAVLYAKGEGHLCKITYKILKNAPEKNLQNVKLLNGFKYI